MGLANLASPAANYLNRSLGTRLIVLMGVLISSSALAMNYFATGLVYLFVLHSVVNGLGAMFTINPPFMIVGDYFPYNHPRYVFATSLIVSGMPLGESKTLNQFI